MKDTTPTQPTFGQRAAAYWFVDGLPHLVLALSLLLAGGLALLGRIVLPDPHWGSMGQIVVLAAVFALYIFYGRYVVDYLKSRLTYPRTGYVEPPEEEERIAEPLTTLSLSPQSRPPQRASVSSFDRRFAMSLFSPLLMVESKPSQEHWFIPLVMFVVAAFLYTLNRKTNPPCTWQSALVLGLMGLVFAWVDVPPAVQPVLPFFLSGLWVAGHGLPKLVHYLSENPQAQIGGRA